MSNDAKQVKQKNVDFRGGGFTPKSKKWVGFVVFFLLISLIETGSLFPEKLYL